MDTGRRYIFGILSYGPVVKNLLASAGDARDMGSLLGSGRSLGVGNGNPLQYSCQENSMDRGAWQAGYSPWGCKEHELTKTLN